MTGTKKYWFDTINSVAYGSFKILHNEIDSIKDMCAVRKIE